MKFKKLLKKVIKLKKKGLLPSPEELGFTTINTSFGDYYIKRIPI